MPKLQMVYTEQINFLTVPGTRALLIAIAFYRGEAGTYAAPARDFIDRGIREWIAGLDVKERKRFDEILDNVNITEGG